MTVNFKYDVDQEVWVNDDTGTPRKVTIFIARYTGLWIDYIFRANEYFLHGSPERYVYTTEQEARDNWDKERKEMEE